MTEMFRPWFRIAMGPAWVLGHFHRRLRFSIDQDVVTYRGARATIFLVALIIAVSYPLVASYIHGTLGPMPRINSIFESASRPYFIVVYAESLPFIIAALAVGCVSPALGVLLMLVFVPSDLYAASVAVAQGNQLKDLTGGLPYGGVLGRFVSYGLLWVLVVEIPAFARDVARRVGSGRAARLATEVGAFAVLAYLWAGAFPWLNTPVFTWTVAVQTTIEAAAVWYYWWVVVVAAVLAATGAAVVRPASADATVLHEPDRAPGPSSLVAQMAKGLLVFALLSGLMYGLTEVVAIGVGLLVAGPGMTYLLSRASVARMSPVLPASARWGLALLVAAGAGLAYSATAGGVNSASSSTIPLIVAAVIPLFRLIVEGGALPPRVTVGSPVIRAFLLGALLGVASWVLLPQSAFADDCPGDCPADPANTAGLMAGAGAAAAAAGAGARASRRPPPPTPPPYDPGTREPVRRPPTPLPPPADFDQQQAEKNSFWRGASDAFKNIKNGWGEFFNN